MNLIRHSVVSFIFLASASLHLTCDSLDHAETGVPPYSAENLSQSEVSTLVFHGLELSKRFNQRVVITVSDREGNILAKYAMGSLAGSLDDALSVRKAQTAAFLSSNQNAFTSLTACFITRPHFPPGISNTPGGPLFGVGFSSLPGADIMPFGNALSDKPGGVPVFKNGILVGGLGVSGGATTFDSSLCTGQSLDELISLGATIGYAPPDPKRGDRILIDGIRFLYANASAPEGNFNPSFDTAGLGSFLVSPHDAPARRFPPSEGYVTLGTVNAKDYNFAATDGTVLTADEVKGIIGNARAQAARTRAAIRAPLGSAAQVFISVVDLNGKVLGIWRTPDATIFSYDVSAQKARTALAFSDPAKTGFGDIMRSILGLPAGQPLAMTTRAVGFLAQDYFPPGIDLETLDHQVEKGPLFEGTDFAYQRRIDSMYSPVTGYPPFGNGVTIFPGGIPLYKNGQLAGAIGVSGDGVDQDDLIASAGTAGYEPTSGVRCDHFSYHGVSLPYVKIPRRPEL